MNLLYTTSLFIILSTFSYGLRAQSNKIDSLKKALVTQKEDSNKVKFLNALSYNYLQYSADTSAAYAQEALNLEKKIGFEQGFYATEYNLASSLMISGNYPLALDNDFKFLALANRKKDTINASIANALIGECYYDLGDYQTSLKYYRENLRLAQMVITSGLQFAWANIAHVYHSLHEPDSSLLYARKAYGQIKDWNDTLFVSNILGDAYAGKNRYDSALFHYRTSIALSIRNHTQLERVDGYNGMALVYIAKGIPDSAAWYAKKVVAEKIEKSYPLGLLKAANLLADIYGAQNKSDSSLKYLRMALGVKDSLFGREKTMAIQNIAFKEQEKQKEIEAEKLQSENRLNLYLLLGGLFALLSIAGLLFRSNRQKQKAAAKIEKAYEELKSTQSQLIQSEKMASLGELTAGIAHEIQNPLNFVNNFSDVNTELVAEATQEIDKGNFSAAKEILGDIKQNEQKINHHGKRADAIVKGMLQHSRMGSGTKEPTDINKLCNEYLHLAYHGIRAKDKSFNAVLKTDFDLTMGNINVVPQDIGRVILNLITNAFYSVDEKKKQQPEGYEPTVIVTTKKMNNKVEISVTDNGSGIAHKIIDKIFQPFFTTKPTGQGTGLGLSLAYDIVKAHGGELKVETKENEVTEFIIQLPGV
jgi:two-component system, NtrC family, sensor kinase